MGIAKIKVLQVNDNLEGGGAELVFKKTSELLSKNDDFAVRTFYGKDRILLEKKDLFDYIYSFKYARIFKKQVLLEKPDIVHLHNFYHYLSPSILHVLKKLKYKNDIKVVATIHDYHFLCANNCYGRWEKGSSYICEKCNYKKYYNIILNRCDPRGFFYQFLKFLQHLIAYNFLKLEKVIDLVIAPSNFVKSKLIHIFPESSISVLINPVFSQLDISSIADRAKTIDLDFDSMFFGRLDPSKGLHVFIENDFDPQKHGNFIIIGTGERSYEDLLQKLVKKKNFEKHIFFLGPKPHDEVLQYLYKSKMVIFPSLLYENCPLVVLESRFFDKEIFHYGYGVMNEVIKFTKEDLCEKKYIANLIEIYKTLNDC